jgi:hypothetical protein
MRSSCVTYASRNSKSGRCRVTRSSHPSFPASTIIASAMVVNAFVVEPLAKSVCVSTASRVPTARTPYPCANATESSFTTATASPGMPQSFTAFAT